MWVFWLKQRHLPQQQKFHIFSINVFVASNSLTVSPALSSIIDGHSK